MKIVDKINNKEIEVETFKECKEYISSVEVLHDTVIIDDNGVILIYPDSVSFRCEAQEEDIKTLELLKNIRTDFSKLINYLNSSNKASELFQKNMSVHMHNPIEMCFEEFVEEWTSFVWKYKFYMENYL